MSGFIGICFLGVDKCGGTEYNTQNLQHNQEYRHEQVLGEKFSS